MYKIFKYVPIRSFTMKSSKQIKKCKTIAFTKEFYENLITNEVDTFKRLLKRSDFPLNYDFLAKVHKVNSLMNDTALEELILDRISQNVTKHGIKTETNFYHLFAAFYANLQYNPDHPLSKELLTTLRSNSYLFDTKERRKLERMLTEKEAKVEKFKEESEYKEERSNADYSSDAEEEQESYDKSNNKTNEKSTDIKNQKSSDKNNEKSTDKYNAKSSSTFATEKKGNKNININKDLNHVDVNWKKANIEINQELKITDHNQITDQDNSSPNTQTQNKSIYNNSQFTNPENNPNQLDNSLKSPLDLGMQFLSARTKLKLSDDNLKLYLDAGNKKATVKSRHFLSKIKIIGLDDNRSENTLKAFNYVDKNRPNTLLLQKRPYYKSSLNSMESSLLYSEESSEGTSCHESLLERKGIVNYCKETFSRPEFKVNTVEQIVYEDVDSFKTFSYMQSLILKASHLVNTNPDLKLILTDITVYKEMENLMDLLERIHPRDFFAYAKLSLLLEKYLWLAENCGKSCPSCDSTLKFESAYNSLDCLVEDFALHLQGVEHPRVKNISESLIKAVKARDYKGNTLVAFVEEKYFYLVVERLARDVNSICAGRTVEEIEREFKSDFNFRTPLGKFNIASNSIGIEDTSSSAENKSSPATIPTTQANKKTLHRSKNNTAEDNATKSSPTSRNEFINKLAICLNVFQNKKILLTNDNPTDSNLSRDNSTSADKSKKKNGNWELNIPEISESSHKSSSTNTEITKANYYLPELQSLKSEVVEPLTELYKLYNDKLNFADEINLYVTRKYDYKCFPNEILINKYIKEEKLVAPNSKKTNHAKH